MKSEIVKNGMMVAARSLPLSCPRVKTLALVPAHLLVTLNSPALGVFLFIHQHPNILTFAVEQKSCKLECSANMADVNAIAGASWSDLVSKFSQKQTWEDYFCYKILLFELDVMLKKWITSKRNRTIEHGECEQLDLMVIESVIRWSSCTQLPTSFRSSLLC
ncbi:hypothetical protein JHK82_025188 [Glycine max]|nr:hypothetical protein JHK82_025188 [Glycine max]